MSNYFDKLYVNGVQYAFADLDARESIERLVAQSTKNSMAYTPSHIKAIVDAGVIDKHFSVGDIIYIEWTDRSSNPPVVYNVPHVVVHIGSVIGNDDKYHDAIMLMWAYTLPFKFSYDAPEACVATESTFQSGYNYYTKNGSIYVMATVTVGDPIPSGTTYYKHNIGGSVMKYGSKVWSKSAIRQWLNSAADKGEWWTAQHDFDVAPDEANTNPGFLDGYSEEWRSLFKPARIYTYTNVANGVYDTTYDSFFIPSKQEVYGVPVTEGDVESVTAGSNMKYLKYFYKVKNTTEPSDAACPGRIINNIIVLDNTPGCAIRTMRLNDATTARCFNIGGNGSVAAETMPLSHQYYFAPIGVIYK